MEKAIQRWRIFWLARSGRGFFGRLATALATLGAPPHKDRIVLSRLVPRGYLSRRAVVHHDDLHLGNHVFVDDRVVLFQRQRSDQRGGRMQIGDKVAIYRDCILETGYGGELSVGAGSSLHPRCQINAYVESIRIGSDVMLAPNCALYSYNHGTAPELPISKQSLQSDGPIEIGDGAWLGVGVIVLANVRIGEGAVVAAGSVVRHDIPDFAIAAGSPAKVIRSRT